MHHCQRHINQCQGCLFTQFWFVGEYIHLFSSIQGCLDLKHNCFEIAFRHTEACFSALHYLDKLFCLVFVCCLYSINSDNYFIMSLAVYQRKLTSMRKLRAVLLKHVEIPSAYQHHQHLVIHFVSLFNWVKTYKVILHPSRRFIYGGDGSFS